MDEKYQRIQVLGKGSFGKAYLVKNTEADELCVVKQMETSMMDPKERNEAVKEAMLLKQMNHPNIVRFQEVFMTRKGRLCIVMDYADDGDVHMHLKKQEGRLLPEPRILEWFSQSCFALKHVHDRKVLHRDLKTQNIFLMKTGQVKLGDFGIARVLDATKDYAKTMVGTPYYLSPEIIEDRPYNFKSDIWSCGVVLYEMTTLKHPFDADSLVILASKILKDQFPDPDASYSDDLKALIRKLLSKDASKRPYIKEVLRLPLLQEPMHRTNISFRLGLDLSEFSAPSTSSSRGPCEGAPRSPAAAAAAAAGPSTPGGGAHAGGAEEEYEEDFERYEEEEFEDYSGSEDEEKQQSELKSSIANLKLGFAGAGGAPGPLPTVPEETSSASATPMASTSAGGTKMSAKAAQLKSYLQGQMPAATYERAYALVAASGEASPRTLASQVGDLIGEDKAPDLLSLFQLLCFLETMSSDGTQAAA
mmetsp:Transcript_105498/g.283583  ORF Transcript_105498/g.283583 Transcript_105498/m.283583 type:complete len:476 (-) Transcript_105498:34-1461(-)